MCSSSDAAAPAPARDVRGVSVRPPQVDGTPDGPAPPAGPTLLAFDTATERVSVALLLPDGQVLEREADGGARASATLLPAIFDVLARAAIPLAAVDAIAFGRGPGAFTGVRTACSVAQGLAFGAAKPVLPIDTLHAIAEDARGGDPRAARCWALLDARMDEIYAACYAFDGRQWSVEVAPHLTTPAELAVRWRVEPPGRVAGQAVETFGARLPLDGAALVPRALPRAGAMLALAAADWHAGRALDAALALPLYLRDKVAQTIAERQAARAAKASAAAGGS